MPCTQSSIRRDKKKRKLRPAKRFGQMEDISSNIS